MKPWLAFVIGGLLLLRLFQLGSSPEATPNSIIGTKTILGAEDGQTRWATWFLKEIGNTAPSPETIGMVVSWQRGEGTEAKFNPLATTQPMAGDTCFNHTSEGRCLVRNYPTAEIGMEATVKTIQNGFYPTILASLLANDPEGAINDTELGIWGTGGGSVRRNYAEWLSQSLLHAKDAPLPVQGTRAQLVSTAMALQGIPYVRGGRSQDGGDCSGTMQYIAKTVLKRDIGATTFSQLDNPSLRDVSDNNGRDLRPGDLWYGQYSDDQHVGMIADVDNDGRWDLINNGGLSDNMHVDYDFLSIPYFSEHTIGYRSIIDE